MNNLYNLSVNNPFWQNSVKCSIFGRDFFFCFCFRFFFCLFVCLFLGFVFVFAFSTVCLLKHCILHWKSALILFILFLVCSSCLRKMSHQKTLISSRYHIIPVAVRSLSTLFGTKNTFFVINVNILLIIIIINTHLYGAQHEGHWAPYKEDTSIKYENTKTYKKRAIETTNNIIHVLKTTWTKAKYKIYNKR